MINNIFEYFNQGISFWDIPQVKIPFAKEFESNTPSKHMWALVLDIHPHSIYAELDPKSRKAFIETDYLEGSFDWSKYQETISKLKKLILSRKERLLVNWETKLEERDYFLEVTPYNEDNFDLLEKAMKETHRMWDNYQRVVDDVLKETGDSALGGSLESLSEQGLI